MQADLEQLSALCQCVEEATGAKKIVAMQKFPHLQPILQLLFDPLQTTGISSKVVEKYRASEKWRPNAHKIASTLTVMDMLQNLYQRTWSGHQGLDHIAQLMEQYKDHRVMILKLINKDLKLNMGIKQLNKAFPGLICDFQVALAHDFKAHESYFKQSIARGEQWMISRKYDGVRVLVMVGPNGKIVTLSRNGAPFASLSKLSNLFTPSELKDVVLDGELCVIDANGKEDFKSSVSQIKRHNYTIEDFCFIVIDCLTRTEFDEGKSTRTLSERLSTTNYPSSETPLRYLRPPKVKMLVSHPWSVETEAKMSAECAKNEWEGLMLRRDCGYVGRRTNDLLKVKKFQEAEYKVVDVVIEDNLLKSVVILHKGNRVHVGSGFTQEQRAKLGASINGKVITVRFFEETEDGSLRFPTFKLLHGAKRKI